MRKLFDLDSPLMGWLNQVFDCMALSILWLLASLPVLTIGAASTALYDAVYHCLKKREGYLWKTFWRSLRENWKRSTLVWLAVLGLLALLSVDAMVFRTMLIQGGAAGKLYYVILLLMLVVLTWFCYLSAYCARINGSVREVLKITATLLMMHPIRAAEVGLFIVAGLLVGAFVPGLLILLPAPLSLMASGPIEAVFRLHMRPEDLEKSDT